MCFGNELLELFNIVNTSWQVFSLENLKETFAEPSLSVALKLHWFLRFCVESISGLSSKNCADSVEPSIAVVDANPPEIT